MALDRVVQSGPAPPTAARPSLLRRLWRMALAASDLYGGMVVIYLALRLLTGYRLWPVVFASAMIHWLLLASLPLFALLAGARRWWRAGLAGVGVVAFIGLYGQQFVPGRGASASCGEQPAACVTVLTLNAGNGLASPDALAAAIRASDSDLIGLQEIPSAQAVILRQALSDAYPYAVFYGDGNGGVGLISRYPIVQDEAFNLLGPRLYLRAVIAVGGQRVTMLVAHPESRGLSAAGYDFPSGDDFSRLAAMAAGGSPTVLVGDLNMAEQSPDDDVLAGAGLRDAYREVGWGFGLTYPTVRLDEAGRRLALPRVLRLDYIWHTPDLVALRAWVGPDVGSDHLPVLAELALYQ